MSIQKKKIINHMDCTYCDRENLPTYYIIDLDSGQEIACEGCNDYLYKQCNKESEGK